MSPVFRQSFTAFVLIVATVLLPIAPQAHLHDVNDYGHKAALVHRHELSQGQHHHDGLTAGDKTSFLDLDDVYLASSPTALDHPPTSSIAVFEPPVVGPRDGAREYVENLIHGPPRAPSPLRGPPPVSRL